jgi:hypothetical protein
MAKQWSDEVVSRLRTIPWYSRFSPDDPLLRIFAVTFHCRLENFGPVLFWEFFSICGDLSSRCHCDVLRCLFDFPSTISAVAFSAVVQISRGIAQQPGEDRRN